MKVRKKTRPRLAAFPERLTQAWQASGMTRCELAKRLGFNQAMVSHWMTGRCEPGLACLVEMAGHLGVTPGYLLGEGEVANGNYRGMTCGKRTPGAAHNDPLPNSESEEPT